MNQTSASSLSLTTYNEFYIYTHMSLIEYTAAFWSSRVWRQPLFFSNLWFLISILSLLQAVENDWRSRKAAGLCYKKYASLQLDKDQKTPIELEAQSRVQLPAYNMVRKEDGPPHFIPISQLALYTSNQKFETSWSLLRRETKKAK